MTNKPTSLLVQHEKLIAWWTTPQPVCRRFNRYPGSREKLPGHGSRTRHVSPCAMYAYFVAAEPAQDRALLVLYHLQDFSGPAGPMQSVCAPHVRAEIFR